MKTELKVALIQTDLAWENPKANRENFTSKIASISETVDLIVLPEMFTSGFTMNASEVAETMDGETIAWLKELSKKKEAAIVGSLVIIEKNNYYNRLVFIHPNGTIDSYDKRHTFTLAGEHKVYTAGTSKTIIDYKGFRICPLICYDLRFPVWARNTEDYDVLLYVANWPKPRISAWDALLKARAIENMSYCIGVNRIGKDDSGHDYPGHSACYDVLGETLSDFNSDENGINVVTLDKSHIEAYRNKLNFLNDRDNFILQGV
ncbi:putative amidohydrolase [Winogradskyella wandonensis]|uniref:Omega-amidase YafV n=1 Tax=Winogradskyella wandonensis TaxID=1442586 RepID=A0A4R1KL74_9FLAO|nr:amidohydrolase [Winogradskyella wandonensis]TCK65090.1 putative amidohydrolase [Winogradskyella wandonensis]